MTLADEERLVAFCDVLGQEQAVRVLQKALAGGRLAHAYLFYGSSGVGKKRTAIAFAKALYCISADTDACDACVACHKIANGNHPDVVLITPEEVTIKIDQVRTIQHRLSYKPYEAQRITIIFDGCEHLTPPAANALLKTLEEPPDSALLLLLTGNKDALPATIVSRCRLIPFQPLALEHLRSIFTQQGMDTDTAALAASLAEGRVDHFSPEDFSQTLAMRQTAYTILQDVTQAEGIVPFLKARQLAGKRDQCEELLRWLSLFIRDLTMLRVAPTVLLHNHDLRTELASLAHRLPLERLIEAFEHLQRLRTYLSLNGNPQLIFEQLLIQIHQAFTVTAQPDRQ